MNAEIMSIENAKKIAEYDKAIDMAKYYKSEYNLIKYKLDDKNREIKRLESKIKRLEKNAD
jgi:hypothetical protein